MKRISSLKSFLIALMLGLGGIGVHSASAQPVRVLISISKERVSTRFANKVSKKLFQHGYSETEFAVKENADQYDLYQALNSPETQALIWISHGATPRLTRKMRRQMGGNTGMSAQPELVDYRGDNVAPIFKKYSPKIKYVAVIGCNSAEILDYVGSNLASDDSVEKLIPSKKIIAQFAIRKAVRGLSGVELDSEPVAVPAPTEELEQIAITRRIPSGADGELVRPLRVLVGDELIAVLPSLSPGEEKTFLIPVPHSKFKQIKLESGQPIMTNTEEVYFGEIGITHPTQVPMKMFAKTDGTPFGLNFRLFILP